jgi:hypothetical protein
MDSNQNTNGISEVIVELLSYEKNLIVTIFSID